MKYDSKQYLYYSLLNGNKITENAINDLIDILGKIEIKPASIRKGKSKFLHDDFAEEEDICDEITLLDTVFNCKELRARCSGTMIIGEIENCSVMLILKGFGDEIHLNFALADPDSGLYLYNSWAFNIGKGKSFLPHIAYYDKQTLELLKGPYKMPNAVILEQTERLLTQKGLTPDESIFFELENHGITNRTLVDKILHTQSKEETIRFISSIIESEKDKLLRMKD